MILLVAIASILCILAVNVFISEMKDRAVPSHGVVIQKTGASLFLKADAASKLVLLSQASSGADAFSLIAANQKDVLVGRPEVDAPSKAALKHWGILRHDATGLFVTISVDAASGAESLVLTPTTNTFVSLYQTKRNNPGDVFIILTSTAHAGVSRFLVVDSSETTAEKAVLGLSSHRTAMSLWNFGVRS
jgi:hypothetical protein